MWASEAPSPPSPGGAVERLCRRSVGQVLADLLGLSSHSNEHLAVQWSANPTMYGNTVIAGSLSCLPQSRIKLEFLRMHSLPCK